MADIPAPHAEFASLSKLQLRALADKLLAPEPVNVDYCVEFVVAETRGLWHGRARAMMCRRLKHCPLGRTNRTKLLACILHRLQTGDFSEQFKEQTLGACQVALSSNWPHVQRCAAWAISLSWPGNTA
jgi:hypothetical protein